MIYIYIFFCACIYSFFCPNIALVFFFGGLNCFSNAEEEYFCDFLFSPSSSVVISVRISFSDASTEVLAHFYHKGLAISLLH